MALRLKLLFSESVKSKIKKKLIQSTKEMTTPDGVTMTEQQYYAENPDELMLEVGRRYIQYYNDMMTLGGGASLKSGGRVGYAEAGPVMGLPSETGLYQKPRSTTMPEETMPEELGGISYEELINKVKRGTNGNVKFFQSNSEGEIIDSESKIEAMIEIVGKKGHRTLLLERLIDMEEADVAIRFMAIDWNTMLDAVTEEHEEDPRLGPARPAFLDL